jgi:hypothetical protein
MKVAEREYSEYDIDNGERAATKPPGISGCFRLRDEAEFMERAILSHLPYLDECVLVVQESQDDTVAIAHRLADEYGKVSVYAYPVIPRFIDHPQWKETPENSIYSFVYLSNWALSKCRYSWIAKTEGDVIAMPLQFEQACETVRANISRPMYYGRIILNVAGAGRDMVSLQNPRNGGWDECIIPNNPDCFFVRRDRWEMLVHSGPQNCLGWSAWHMKRCKAEFLPGPWNGETYLPMTPENVAAACRGYNQAVQPYPGGDGFPEGRPELFEIGGKSGF